MLKRKLFSAKDKVSMEKRDELKLESEGILSSKSLKMKLAFLSNQCNPTNF